MRNIIAIARVSRNGVRLRSFRWCGGEGKRLFERGTVAALTMLGPRVNPWSHALRGEKPIDIVPGVFASCRSLLAGDFCSSKADYRLQAGSYIDHFQPVGFRQQALKT